MKAGTYFCILTLSFNNNRGVHTFNINYMEVVEQEVPIKRSEFTTKLIERAKEEAHREASTRLIDLGTSHLLFLSIELED